MLAPLYLMHLLLLMMMHQLLLMNLIKSKFVAHQDQPASNLRVSGLDWVNSLVPVNAA
jgi:hypothetical protein